MDTPTIEDVTAKIVELRARKKDMESKARELDTVVDRLENFLLQKMQESGLTSMSVRTEHGKVTVSHKTTRRANVADWESLLEYILTHNKRELFYRNINSKNAIDLVEAGEEIPGINIFATETVSIRRV